MQQRKTLGKFYWQDIQLCVLILRVEGRNCVYIVITWRTVPVTVVF